MKCSVCGSDQVVYAPSPKLRLCRDHFNEYFHRRFKKMIEKYKVLRDCRKVMVAVSGGKDSVVLLNVLARFSEEYGLELIGLTIDLGIKDYSSKCVEIAVKNYDKLSIDYRVIKLNDEYGVSIDSIAKIPRRVMRRPLCSICGIIKRYVLNKVALELEVDAIATGHNLDDMIKFMITNMYNGRIIDLIKLVPKIPSRGKLVTKIRPLAFFTNEETLIYALANNLDFNQDKCPYMPPEKSFQNTIQKAIDLIEKEYPGFKLHFYNAFISKIQPLLATKYEESPLYECIKCGMPTSSKDVCAFCRIRERAIQWIKRRGS